MLYTTSTIIIPGSEVTIAIPAVYIYQRFSRVLDHKLEQILDGVLEWWSDGKMQYQDDAS